MDEGELVTGETLVQYVQDRMPARDPEPIAAKPEPKDEPKPEPEAKPEPKPEEHDGGKLQDRFNKLAQQRREAEDRAAAAEARARDLEARLNPPKTDEIEAKIGPKPLAKDFTDIEQYGEKLAEWGGKRAILLDAQQRERQQANSEREKQVETFRSRQTEFRVTHADYDEVVGSAASIPVAQDLLDEILASDVGLAVQYHLGQNHDEIERLNKLSPTKRMLEFGRLEERLRLAQKSTEPELKAPIPITTRQRQAPPEPIKPISTAGGTSGADSYFDQSGEFTGTPEQWRALRSNGKIK